MKPTAAFKLSKSAKRQLATIMDPHLRGAVKRSLIDAELTQAHQPKRERSARPSFGTENLTD